MKIILISLGIIFLVSSLLISFDNFNSNNQVSKNIKSFSGSFYDPLDCKGLESCWSKNEFTSVSGKAHVFKHGMRTN